MGGQELFLDPADRQDPSRSVISPVIATFRLTGISVRREMMAVAMVMPRTALPWRSSFRDVDMDIEVLVQIPGDVELEDHAPHIAESGLGRFLHDLAQLSGQREISLTVDFGRLEGQELPAELGPAMPMEAPISSFLSIRERLNLAIPR